MAVTVIEDLKTYLAGLPATNLICSELGTTMSASSNLFMFVETQATLCISLHYYGGASPDKDRYKQEAAVQIRVKAPTIQKSIKVSQQFINNLHEKKNVFTNTNGKITANQSVPIPLDFREGGESYVTVSNYTIKYVKL